MAVRIKERCAEQCFKLQSTMTTATSTQPHEPTPTDHNVSANQWQQGAKAMEVERVEGRGLRCRCASNPRYVFPPNHFVYFINIYLLLDYVFATKIIMNGHYHEHHTATHSNSDTRLPRHSKCQWPPPTTGHQWLSGQ
jgi:hypothetical protein